jgi:ABC-2 type transport system ATP-binding protein
VTAVIETEGVGKRYRRLWALTDCTLSVPSGHVVGLVGPNGPGRRPAQPGHRDGGGDYRRSRCSAGGRLPVRRSWPESGLAQHAPVYAGLSVADRRAWARTSARAGMPAGAQPNRATRLSLGQRGDAVRRAAPQLALTLAVASGRICSSGRPVASPTRWRAEFLQDLMEAVAEQGSASCSPRSGPGTGLRLDRGGPRA